MTDAISRSQAIEKIESNIQRLKTWCAENRGMAPRGTMAESKSIMVGLTRAKEIVESAASLPVVPQPEEKPKLSLIERHEEFIEDDPAEYTNLYTQKYVDAIALDAVANAARVKVLMDEIESLRGAPVVAPEPLTEEKIDAMIHDIDRVYQLKYEAGIDDHTDYDVMCELRDAILRTL
jgi:hypothetical protein